MPRGDGTGPDGKSPKAVNKGFPTPKRDGKGFGRSKAGRGKAGGRKRGQDRQEDSDRR